MLTKIDLKEVKSTLWEDVQQDTPQLYKLFQVHASFPKSKGEYISRAPTNKFYNELTWLQ